jgi:hypothetical protein
MHTPHTTFNAPHIGTPQPTSHTQRPRTDSDKPFSFASSSAVTVRSYSYRSLVTHSSATFSMASTSCSPPTHPREHTHAHTHSGQWWIDADAQGAHNAYELGRSGGAPHTRTPRRCEARTCSVVSPWPDKLASMPASMENLPARVSKAHFTRLPHVARQLRQRPVHPNTDRPPPPPPNSMKNACMLHAADFKKVKWFGTDT